MYPCRHKEDLIVRLELNSPEEVILCSGDTAATYKFSDICLEYDAIFYEPYAKNRKWTIYWNGIDSVYPGNINPLPKST